MIYSETAADWVPRWGKGSAKQIDKNAEWAIEEKPGQEGKDPFATRNQEKKLNLLREKRKELKNDERNKKTGNKKEDGNGKAPQKTQFSKKDRKIKKDEKATERISKDKKNLSRTLETVQKSTASMGNFDKKLKNEKELNILKKKKKLILMLCSAENMKEIEI